MSHTLKSIALVFTNTFYIFPFMFFFSVSIARFVTCLYTYNSQTTISKPWVGPFSYRHFIWYHNQMGGWSASQCYIALLASCIYKRFYMRPILCQSYPPYLKYNHMFNMCNHVTAFVSCLTSGSGCWARVQHSLSIIITWASC